MKKNKVLIFGGSGFIGSHLAELLFKNKYDVTIFDKFRNNSIIKDIKYIKGSIDDKKKILKITKNYDYIFNFAAISDIGKANISPISTININLIGTINILEAIKKQKKLKDLFLLAVFTR